MTYYLKVNILGAYDASIVQGIGYQLVRIFSACLCSIFQRNYGVNHLHKHSHIQYVQVIPAYILLHCECYVSFSNTKIQ